MRLVRYGSRDSDGMVWWWGRQDQSNLMGRRVVVGRGSASCKRTDGCESRRGEVGAENDNSAQRNTDGVDPDLVLQCRVRATMLWSLPRGGLRRKD
jgi:hypothetical protein